MGAHRYCRRRQGKWGHPNGLRKGRRGGVSHNCDATPQDPRIIAMGETPSINRTYYRFTLDLRDKLVFFLFRRHS
jgi:hypothetical protein